ncbi:MAG: Stp1/IreP family PP2C-type Ser/Thr phosphatase [Candidatus Rifleibacteriota bacterium]
MGLRYSAYGTTNIGKVREHNEDAFYVSDKGGFFIVSDGMGGLAAGEVASRITKETISKILEESFATAKSVEALLKKAFLQANAAVRKALDESSRKKGMGCTCVVLAFRDNDFFIAYVGDSRIYLYRSGKLKQITRDHSYVEELFLRGLISEEEKKDHPYKNTITRYVGHADTLEVDISSGPVSNNDTFLLCSDGLSGEVDDSEIERILGAETEPEKQVNALVEKALENGGGDNITAIVVKVEKKSPGFFKKLLGW